MLYSENDNLGNLVNNRYVKVIHNRPFINKRYKLGGVSNKLFKLMVFGVRVGNNATPVY